MGTFETTYLRVVKQLECFQVFYPIHMLLSEYSLKILDHYKLKKKILCKRLTINKYPKYLKTKIFKLC